MDRFHGEAAGAIAVGRRRPEAIRAKGRSLLAAGIVEVEGRFVKGDIVALRGPDGAEIARGLTNYGHEDLDRIKGLRTTKIAEVLGECPYEEVIHRDNMVVTAHAGVDRWRAGSPSHSCTGQGPANQLLSQCCLSLRESRIFRGAKGDT